MSNEEEVSVNDTGEAETGPEETVQTDSGTGGGDGEVSITPEKMVGTTRPEDVPEGPTSYWPTDWREQLANGDEKVLQQLRRFTDPSGIWKKVQNQNKMISSGRYTEAAPDSSDPVAMARWRQQNGIPESPEGYFDYLPEDLQLDDDDKELFQSIFDAVHPGNARPEDVKEALARVFEYREAAEQKLAERDSLDRQDAQLELSHRWGRDNFKRYLRANTMWWDEHGGDELRTLIMSARGPDGRRLGNNPDVVQLFVDQALEQFTQGDITLPVKPGFTQEQAMSDRLSELRGMMRDARGPYWNGPQADQLQGEYRQLLDAEERMAGKGRR